MIKTFAAVPTASASKYLQQLCKHWSHKLDVSFTPEAGTVRFPSQAVATMTAHTDHLLVSVETLQADQMEQMQGVVARHLDRFAFREAPLAFAWQAETA
jgi:uncharacterized protein